MGAITLISGHKFPFYGIVAIVWVLTYACANAEEQEGGDIIQGDNRTCEVPECKEMADIIKRQMGKDKPCDDFSNYVCGNWRGHKELQPTRLKEKAVATLAGLLKNASESEKGDNATDKLIRAYESCTQRGKDNQTLINSIIYVISGYNVTNRTWPITNDTLVPSTSKESDDYVNVLKMTGPRPVFSFFVSKRNGAPYISMTKPSEFFVIDVETTDSTIMKDAEGTPESTTVDYSNYDDLAATLLIWFHISSS